MQIEYRTGDLLLAPENILIHGCNAQGSMQSGIAKHIRAVYPEVYTEYRNRFESTAGLVMGEVVWVFTRDSTHLFANAITQKFYGRDEGRRYCSYDAIDRAFEEINRMAAQGSESHVAMPLIGAGLAQGDWQIIARIIERRCQDVIPVVYTLDGVIPT